jgi:serine/threonine protein kinase
LKLPANSPVRLPVAGVISHGRRSERRLAAEFHQRTLRVRSEDRVRFCVLRIVPQAFTLDPDRLARFKHEAQVLAALNHPHIAAIYEFEDADRVHAIVLELVEGETLADRVAKGPILLDEALFGTKTFTPAYGRNSRVLPAAWSLSL